MTNQEWLECTDLFRMFDFARSRGAPERKLHLFGVACCRRAWSAISDPAYRAVVEAAERYADGLLDQDQFEGLTSPVLAAWGPVPSAVTNVWGIHEFRTQAVRHLCDGRNGAHAASFIGRGLACLVGVRDSPEWIAACQEEENAQCDALRDVIGDPSRPFAFSPAWLAGEGASAVALARQLYDEGRFDALPTLADVLERSGCTDRAVLDHCRGTGPHVRGCWVVDALLGREGGVRQGLMTAADWQRCDQPEPMMAVLAGSGSARKWRLLALACCRRIDHLITDPRSRRAVEVAVRYVEGEASDEELSQAGAEAEQASKEARDADWRAEAEANFSWSPAYAAAGMRAAAADAACHAACQDPLARGARGLPPALDSAAAAMHGSASASGSTDFGERCEQENDAWLAELRAGCDLLRDLFGDHFGPPGQESGWLPYPPGYGGENNDRQWCLLPTRCRPIVRPEWLAWQDGTVLDLAHAIYAEQAFDRMGILADALEDAGCADEILFRHLRSPGPHVRGCWVVDLILGKE